MSSSRPRQSSHTTMLICGPHLPSFKIDLLFTRVGRKYKYLESNSLTFVTGIKSLAITVDANNEQTSYRLPVFCHFLVKNLRLNHFQLILDIGEEDMVECRSGKGRFIFLESIKKVKIARTMLFMP